VNITPVKQPYPGPFVPPSQLPELQATYATLTSMQRGYKWVSKDATYTMSSVYDNCASPSLLNGERGCTSGDTNACHTRAEDSPWLSIDLGTKHSITALDISNRIGVIEAGEHQSDTLTVWVSDAAEGPWKEIWHTQAAQMHWAIVLEKAVECRFVKVGLTRHACLHLNEVRVFEKR